MVNCNVLNDVSKCYYVAEMDEINIISYHIISSGRNCAHLHPYLSLLKNLLVLIYPSICMIDASAEGETDGSRGILNLLNQSGDCIFTKRSKAFSHRSEGEGAPFRCFKSFCKHKISLNC
jgi:hypothetical protein